MDDSDDSDDLLPQWGNGHPPGLSLQRRGFDSRMRRFYLPG